jgi:hypothetical protein
LEKYVSFEVFEVAVPENYSLSCGGGKVECACKSSSSSHSSSNSQKMKNHFWGENCRKNRTKCGA